MATATLVAQAKVNLFLNVLAREASGFHQLETLFCRLALGDRIRIKLGASSSRSLDFAGEALPPEGLGPLEKNLAWRAATAFLEAAGWSTGFSIEIEKRIPVGGGLGGGSADAGGVLRALNALAPSPLTEQRLLEIGASLGADVPFLTQASSALALAWGRGDRLMPLPPLASRPVLLVVFPFGVPTADAYRWLTAEPAALPGARAFTAEQLGEWQSVDALSHNEFERIISPRFEMIREVLETLGSPAVAPQVAVARMSGSGSTVFALPPIGATAMGSGVHEGWSDEVRRAIRTVNTSTASHVESVRLGD